MTARQEPTRAGFTAATTAEGVSEHPCGPDRDPLGDGHGPGGKTAVAQEVKVEEGLPAAINHAIEPGEVNDREVITGRREVITGRAAVLQSESATIATTITGRQIRELPCLSRNP